MNQAQARDLHEASIVSPQLRSAMLEGGESDLQVENAGTGDVEIDGELQQTIVEADARCPDLHASLLAEVAQEGRRAAE